MNCKPGDLAILVRSLAGNEGKIVRCIRFVGSVPGWIGCDRWEVDVLLNGNFGKPTKTVQDAWLRPIRYQGGEDEILRIAGKPQKETA